jgi:hypothetical protein
MQEKQKYIIKPIINKDDSKKLRIICIVVLIIVLIITIPIGIITFNNNKRAAEIQSKLIGRTFSCHNSSRSGIVNESISFTDTDRARESGVYFIWDAKEIRYTNETVSRNQGYDFSVKVSLSGEVFIILSQHNSSYSKQYSIGCGNQQNFGKHFANEVRQKKVADIICLNDGKPQTKRYIYKG